jgi:hypothetical protein
VRASVKAAEEAEEEERKRQKEIEERRLQELQAAEKARALRTFRWLSVALGVLLLLSVAAAFYTRWQRQSALLLVAEAMRQRAIAEEAQKEAVGQRVIAEEARKEAEGRSEAVLGSRISDVTGLPDDLAQAFAKAPSDRRDPAYMDMSIRVQAKLKELILDSMLKKPQRFANLASASPFVVYTCIPPTTGQNDIYWDWPDVSLRRSMAYDPRTIACLEKESARIKELLASQSLENISQFYEPSQASSIVGSTQSRLGDVLLSQLLRFEAATVDALSAAAIEIAKVRTLKSASIPSVNAAFSSFQANLDKAARAPKEQTVLYEDLVDLFKSAGHHLSPAIEALLSEAARAFGEVERPRAAGATKP